MYVVPGACRQTLRTAGQLEVGARAANLHTNERLLTPEKLTERLRHSRRSPCEHMQQTGWCRQLTEVSLARSCEQAALGAAHLEHANEQLQACLEEIGRASCRERV